MDKGVGKHQKVRSVTAKTEIRVDKGPFMPGPERVAVLAAVPEPSPVLLLLTGVAGVALASRLRRGTRDK